MENDLGRRLRDCADPFLKDQYTQEVLTLSDSAMRELKRKRTKRYSTLADKLRDIGAFVKDAMQESGSQKPYPLSSYFTCISLAALVFDDWENPHALSTRVSQAIVREFKEDKKGLETFLELSSIPSIHLYRQAIGVYTGNLEDAKMTWRKIDVSEDDWLYSVHLPLQLDEKLAFVLGVVFGDGCYDRSALDLTGSSKDTLFYREVLKPLLEELFHKSFSLDLYREIQIEAPRISLGSTAISSFFSNEFDFPRAKKDYAVPDFARIDVYQALPPEKKEAVKRSFFAGILASLAAYQYNQNRNTISLFLNDKDERFMLSIIDFSKQLRLFPKYHQCSQPNDTDSHRIVFSGSKCRQLYREGYVLNPAHYTHPSLIGFLSK